MGDTPERIMQFTSKITRLSQTSSGNHPWAIYASYVVHDTGVCNEGTAYSSAALEYGERPALNYL